MSRALRAVPLLVSAFVAVLLVAACLSLVPVPGLAPAPAVAATAAQGPGGQFVAATGTLLDTRTSTGAVGAGLEGEAEVPGITGVGDPAESGGEPYRGGEDEEVRSSRGMSAASVRQVLKSLRVGRSGNKHVREVDNDGQVYVLYDLLSVGGEPTVLYAKDSRAVTLRDGTRVALGSGKSPGPAIRVKFSGEKGEWRVHVK